MVWVRGWVQSVVCICVWGEDGLTMMLVPLLGMLLLPGSALQRGCTSVYVMYINALPPLRCAFFSLDAPPIAVEQLPHGTMHLFLVRLIVADLLCVAAMGTEAGMRGLL